MIKKPLLLISIAIGTLFFLLFWLIGSWIFEENIFLFSLLGGFLFFILVYTIFKTSDYLFKKKQIKFEKTIHTFEFKVNTQLFVDNEKYTLCIAYVFKDKIIVKEFEKSYREVMIDLGDVLDSSIQYAYLWINTNQNHQIMLVTSEASKLHRYIQENIDKLYANV